MRTTAPHSILFVVVLIAGCAGPLGPPLGLGPGGDELAGLFIIGLIAALAYRPVRRFFSTSGKGIDTSSPMDIARERYARGDINQEEFERMKQQLS